MKETWLQAQGTTELCGLVQPCAPFCRELPVHSVTQGFKKTEPCVYVLTTEQLLNLEPYPNVMSLGVLESLGKGAEGILPGLSFLPSSPAPGSFFTLDITHQRQALIAQ